MAQKRSDGMDMSKKERKTKRVEKMVVEYRADRRKGGKNCVIQDLLEKN
jgi:hypothetical protein